MMMYSRYDNEPKLRNKKHMKGRDYCDICCLQGLDTCCHKDDNNEVCVEQDCICEQLRSLARGTIVILSTTGLNINDMIAARFIQYDETTRCVTFRLLSLDLIVRCRDIRAIIV